VAHCLGLTFCPLPECAEFVCCDVLYVVWVWCARWRACYFTQKLLNCLKQNSAETMGRNCCLRKRGVPVYVHGHKY